MPKIPGYELQTMPGGPAGAAALGRRATGEDFAGNVEGRNALSQGLKDLGQGLTQLAITEVRNEIKRNQAEKQSRLSDLHARLAEGNAELRTGLKTRVEKAEPGDESIVEDTTKAFNAFRDQIDGQTQSQAERDYARKTMAQIGSELTISAMQAQGQLKGLKYKVDNQKALTAETSALIDDPSGEDSAVSRMQNYMQAQLNAGAPKPEMFELESTYRSELANAAANGWARRDPLLAKKLLESGKWNAFLDNDRKKAIYNSIETEINRREADARAARIEARQAKIEAQTGLTTGFILRMALEREGKPDDKLGVDITSSGLPGSDIEHLLDNRDKWTKRREEEQTEGLAAPYRDRLTKEIFDLAQDPGNKLLAQTVKDTLEEARDIGALSATGPGSMEHYQNEYLRVIKEPPSLKKTREQEVKQKRMDSLYDSAVGGDSTVIDRARQWGMNTAEQNTLRRVLQNNANKASAELELAVDNKIRAGEIKDLREVNSYLGKGLLPKQIVRLQKDWDRFTKEENKGEKKLEDILTYTAKRELAPVDQVTGQPIVGGSERYLAWYNNSYLRLKTDADARKVALADRYDPNSKEYLGRELQGYKTELETKTGIPLILPAPALNTKPQPKPTQEEMNNPEAFLQRIGVGRFKKKTE
jgi:hypothetical protein